MEPNPLRSGQTGGPVGSREPWPELASLGLGEGKHPQATLPEASGGHRAPDTYLLLMVRAFPLFTHGK